MTFLKKLGQILAQGVAIATGVWPLVQNLFGSNAKVQSTVPVVINDLTSVGQIVVQAEALIQQSGSGGMKLASAAPLVANIVRTSELVSGHKIKNETLFIQGCTDITSGVAEVLNSLDSGGLQTNGNAIPPIPPAQQAPAPVLPTSAPPAPAPKPTT